MVHRIKSVINKLRQLRPSLDAMRKALIAAGLVAAVTVAFFLGRKGALSGAQAQAPGTLQEIGGSPVASDPNLRIVAYIHGNIPITREELGEYLIARFGAERTEMLVHRRIVDMACKAANIYVTEAEINAQLQEDLKSFKIMSIKDFENVVLRRYNKSLYEWKEDYIRPKLQMAKLVRPTITVTADDLKKAFEARYHEKVECRMIVLLPEQKAKWDEIWHQVSGSEQKFDEWARTQPLTHVAANAGKVPPIHKHFGDPKIEAEVFKLKDGQVSSKMEMPDGSAVIFKRDKLIPADTTVREEDVRVKLHEDIREFKLAQEIPKAFQQLMKQANPQVYLRPQPRQQDLERSAQQLIQNRPADTMIRPASTDPK